MIFVFNFITIVKSNVSFLIKKKKKDLDVNFPRKIL